MFEHLPEWGPAKHRSDHPSSNPTHAAGLQASLDQRDGAGMRPDDN
ncbi:hypothetical protein GCM10027596_28240 [Nocardioides korecus]